VAPISGQAVPWGRSLNEYSRMFGLTARDLESKILDCAAGPASFNAEMHARGASVVSCDPIYKLSAGDIRKRIGEAFDALLDTAEAYRDKFVWQEIESPKHLGRVRLETMNRFLGDFSAGFREGRYRALELPALPFRDGEFDLALCSHFLFTYSDSLTLGFHLDSIRELCRVAKEARIFPLVTSFAAECSPHLSAVIETLGTEGYSCEVTRVPYEFQKGANQMLRVSLSRF
jgi:hypothetical protein